MTEPVVDEDDPWRLIREYYCERGRLGHGPNERYRISGVARDLRRKALSEIFAILGATTFRQRLMATRVIVEGISEYHCDTILRLSPSSRRRWFSEIAAHAAALARLAGAYPREFGFFVMGQPGGDGDVRFVIRLLNRWAKSAAWRVGESLRSHALSGVNVADARSDADDFLRALLGAAHGHRKATMDHQLGRKRRDSRQIDLVDDLEQLYLLATDRNVSRSVDDVTGKRDPFIGFMDAVWTLAGVKRGEHAIIKDIRGWRDYYRAELEADNDLDG